MRTLNRNKSPFWYLLYDSKAPAKDEYGNETGEELVIYKPAVAMNRFIIPLSINKRIYINRFYKNWKKPIHYSTHPTI